MATSILNHGISQSVQSACTNWKLQVVTRTETLPIGWVFLALLVHKRSFLEATGRAAAVEMPGSTMALAKGCKG